MAQDRKKRYVIGVDYGTDSCRAILLDSRNGKTLAESTCYYPRWMKGKYCEPLSEKYRQHPQDYIDSFKKVISDIVAEVGPDEISCLEGITFDTTSSTVAIVNCEGTPLALTKDYKEDPDAMFVLWKDHTAKEEADTINELAHNWEVDYTTFSGGTFSPEWTWAKVLHILRNNQKVADAAYSWVEHCDWITAWLIGETKPEKLLRSRCAAGHKAMWRAEWGGLPSEDFLNKLDPRLGAMRSRLYEDTYTSDVCAGFISKDLAKELGLPETLKVGVGLIDAHVGAVGASITEGSLVRIMGTSACDIVVSSKEKIGDKQVKGICGQVDGSVIPGLIGFEAGQAAFGDIYAWFRKVLLWPIKTLLPEKAEDFKERILPALEKEATNLAIEDTYLIALDWFNGRRSPDSDPRVKSAILGLSLSTTAPMIYRALIEATAFGTKAIMDRYLEEGIEIKEVRAIGGISQKSELVMQIMSDVLGLTVKVVDSDQACALGSGMLAATVCGIYETVEDAQEAMGAPIGKVFKPNMENHNLYLQKYQDYLSLGEYSQNQL